MDTKMLVLLIIFIFSASFSVAGANFTCYSCYYSIEHLNDSWNQPECMNRPTELKGLGVKRPCSQEKFCIIQEMFDIRTNQVREFSRSCAVVGYQTECIKDTYNIVCRTSCKGDLCNRNDTAITLMENNSSILYSESTRQLCVLVIFVIWSLNVVSF